MFLSNISISRPVFTVMVILALVVFGYISYSRLGIDLMPDVEFGYLTITTIYPGADPETVETEVVNKIEEEVSTLPGIKSIMSRSVENVGLVVIEYELDIDVDIAAQDVRARVDSIRRNLPEDIETPVVQKLDIGAMPIMSVAVSADMPLTDLTKFVEDKIKARLESINGVGSVKMVGGQEREIQVRIDPNLLRERGISIEEVIGALKVSNVEIPGGRIETGTREFVVKTKGRLTVANEFADLIVRSTENGVIRLNDIADVEDTLEDKRSLARLNGKDAIALVVMKKSKANTVEIADRINEEVEKLRKELPPGIDLAIPQDDSIFIRASFHELMLHLFYGALFAVIVVFLFLRSPRSTLISAVAIPTSIIGTFSFMHALGFTLNILTMLGLSLSVGMLIDDAIVVLENIYRHMERGENKIDAARNATAEIGLAVMATTFSIVAVFFPVAFTYGIVGRFMYQFGMTVSFAVLISLFVSFTLTPMLASQYLVVAVSHGWFYKLVERALKGLDSGYRQLLRRALRYKAITVIVAVGIFIFSLWIARLIPSEFQSKMDQESFAISIYTPAGSPISTMENIIAQAEETLKDLEGFESIFATVGTGSIESVTEGSIQIALVPREERKKSQEEISIIAREKLSNISGAKFAVSQEHSFGSGKSGDIEVALKGQDIDKLNLVADKLIETWKNEASFVDIDKTYEAGKPEIRLIVNRERSSDMGLSIYGIASTVNSLVSGETAVTTFREAGEDYDVKVRLKRQFRDEPQDILALPILTNENGLIDLGSVIDIESGYGPSEINHLDKQRTITVVANLEGLPLGTAKQRTTEIMREILVPDVEYSFTGMSEIMEESFASLFFSMGLAIIIIYMLLASQFESFIHPLSIMISLPLSLIGALGALLLSGLTINMITLIGIIMLMGLVTKNAILLIDYTNTLRKRGLEREEAILEAGPVRLRPILMTTAAMVFGMLPVALARGSGSEIQAPMAVCVIGGLITSMLLTLVVVPVVYSIFDGWVERVNRLFNREKKTE